jgi:hypothetical protein
MLTTVEGTYQDGEITLQETPKGVKNGKVLVTFLNESGSKPAHQQMAFGQFAGSILLTEEDFKIAEWHGEEEFDDLNGG